MQRNVERSSETRERTPPARRLRSATAGDVPPTAPNAPATRQRPASLACAWCSAPIVVKARGRIPQWCSQTCRHRAWEQQRAAASGQSTVQFVERVVEVPVEVVRHVEVPTHPQGPAWAAALEALTRQLDAGRIYDRDLPALSTALGEVLDAFARRRRMQNR